MDIRRITADYAVSPQITPQDVAAIKAAGFVTILCNRPDAEVPPDVQAAAVGAAAEAAGLGFVVNPVTHQGLNMEMVRRQMDTIAEAGGPVFAYCASGTRCSIVWSLGQAGKMPTEAIIAATARAGYDLSHLAGRLDDLARG
jgi:uncharacterized protein (TIGR01244 family)